MKPRLLSILGATLAAAAVAAPAAQAASTTVVVQAVAFRGPTGGNDEFIQIKNISTSPQSIGGWEIWGSNAGGTSTGSRAKVPAGVTLPAGKSYLFTNVQPGDPTPSQGGEYSLGVPGDLEFTTGIGDTGGLQLRNGSGTVVDAVGHTGVVAAWREGTGLPFPTANGNDTFVRKAAPDTDNNANDFTGPQAHTPENCGTACVGGPVEPGEGCQAVPAVTPITSVQTLGAQSACNGTRVRIKGIVTGIDNLYGSTYDAIYKGDSGIWIQEATRSETATTSSAIFVAGIRRATTNPEDVIGREVVIEGRANAKFGQVEIVPDGVGSTTNPNAQEVDLSTVAVSVSADKKPLPAPVALDQAKAEEQDPINRPYYRALQGMRVTLPVGIATGGGTTKFRDVFVEPGTDATRLFRKNNAAAVTTPWSDAPAELGISPDGGAGNPADPRLPWRSTTQVDLDLFDVVKNVTGPLSYSFSYFKIVPQLTGAPAPTIERGPINAAYPPAVPTPAQNSLRVASFNVENLFPVGKSNDGHTITQAEYDERVRTIVLAVRNFLKEPDVIAVQEVAVFADGANALTGLAAALGNYTGYIAPNNDGRGIAPGFLVKNGTTASGGRVVGADVPGPWANAGVCDLYPGKLFDRAPYALDLKKGDISFTALSNHWASQSHQDQCRIDEAAWVRTTATDLQQQGKQVLVAGDLNDFEFSTSLGTLAQGNVLTNLWTKAPAGQAYSYKFNGHLQTLDHIFVTAGLESRVTDFRYVHFDNDYYERPEGDGTGISDHDPPVVTFGLQEGASVSQPSTLTGSVPATLALTIGNASFGTFTPGDARDYSTTLDATVTSTGEDATLSVADGSSTAPGRLVNGAHALRSAVQINADGGAFAPLRTDNGALTLASWAEPISTRKVTLGFKQSIAGDEGLRTGSYAKTLTFTLSTTAP